MCRGMLVQPGRELRCWDWSCDGQGHFFFLYFLSTPHFSLVSTFFSFFSFFPAPGLGSAFGLGLGIGGSGVLSPFAFFGMVFVFIFFLLSIRVLLCEGLRFFEVLVCRVV